MEEIETLVKNRAAPHLPSLASKRQKGTIPSQHPNSIQRYLREAFQEFQQLAKGRPNCTLLRKPEDDVNALTISVVTTEGQTFQTGETRQKFPLLALAKPFVFGLALEDRGIDQVAQKIGLEPTGAAFDQLLGQQELAGRRFNPMVNLGAVATTSMILGPTTENRRTRILQKLSSYLGRPATVDEETFNYRRRHDTRCRALTYFMAAENLLTASVDETLELYHAQSSVRISCQDAATMAATLAHHGTNPRTGERAVEAEHVKRLLSVMFTSGLYESSGQWAYRNGIPAITSLAGAIMAVVPGRMGIAVYSPRLDERGNSVRGIKTFEALSSRLGLHVFEPGEM